MTRKVLSLVLAALMLCSVLPVMASAHSATVLQEEIFSDSQYYHLEYVQKQNYFKDDINLYTALGLYDGAWYNYFTKDVDIDYATSILLALIEKVDVEYQNEDFEKFVKILKTASSAADVINKVNKYTGLLDFAKSSEWSSAVSTLNTLIKVADYGNATYEKFIDGYAAILSAKAASNYYSDLLQYLIDHCENAAVRQAAANILANINAKMEDAVKNLVAELAKGAGEDAVDAGVSAAMATNPVTAAIKSAYGVSTSLANKLFKTSSKYGYMCSLAESYYIETCLLPWAEEKLALGDDQASMKSFAISAFITLRSSGESLLEGLAATSDKTIMALTKSYNVTELKVKSATAIAKLSVIRELIKAGVADTFTAIFTSVGDNDLVARADSLGSANIDGDAALALTKNVLGYGANIYDETLGTYVKVLVLNASSDAVNAMIHNPTATTVSYLQLDSITGGSLVTKYATVPVKAGITVTSNDITADYSGEKVPTISAYNGSETVNASYSAAFSTTALTFVFPSASSQTAEEKALTFNEKVAAFFNQIGSFFVKLFKILK